MEEFVINNEKDFFASINGENERIFENDISFENWPILSIKISGDRYHGTITSELAKSLYDFSMQLQRAYCYLKYNTHNLQRLTVSDKEIFNELSFRVTEGSSNIVGDLAKPFTAIFSSLKEATEGMESKHKAAIYSLFIFVGIGSYTAYKISNDYFGYQQHIETEQQQTHRQEIIIDGQKKTIEEVTQLAHDAINNANPDRQHSMKGAIDKIDHGYTDVIKSAPDADEVSMPGASFNHEQLQEITTRQQEKTHPVIQTEEFIIDGIRRANFPKISIALSNLDGDKKFTASFEYGFISSDSYDRIFDAVKNNKTIKIKYQAIVTNSGVYKNVSVLDAESGRIIGDVNQHSLDDEE